MSVGLTSRRALACAKPLALVTLMTCGLLALWSAPALATGDGTVVTAFSAQPASPAAGGAPNVTSTTSFAAGTSANSVSSVTVTLPPGLLAAPAAVTQTCSSAQLNTNPVSCPLQSVIGGGSVDASIDGGGSVAGAPVVLYLMPAANPTTDVAGIGAVITVGGTPVAAQGTVRIVTNGSGQPVGQISVPGLPNVAAGIHVHVTQLTLTFNGKAADGAGVADAGADFIRMPTNCSPGTASLAVTTYASTNGSGSDTITPTGCAALPYSPSVTVSATKDADSGVSISAQVTQPAGQAATQSLTVQLPTNGLLSPNVAAATSLLCNAPAPFTGCTPIGTATGSTPLLSGPLSGNVYLLGPISQTLKIAAVLGAPFNVEIDGTANLANNTVVFSNLPDVPLASLTLALKSSPEAFTTSCTPSSGTGSGSATGQGGQPFSATVPITIAGCPSANPGGNNSGANNGGTSTTPGAPTFSGIALGGLGKGKAFLKFKLAAGKNGAPKIQSFKVKLPTGLKFNAKAFSAKNIKKAISIGGGGKFTASISGGALVVKLKTAASKLTVSISSSAFSVSTALKKNAKKGKIALEKVIVAVTDAKGKTTTLTLSFKKPK